MSVCAQTLQDVVYLLNGSVVRGTLIEQVPNVKIRTTDGSLLVFKHEEIDKITSEPAEQQSSQHDASQYDAPPQFEATKNSGSRIFRGYYRDLSGGMRIFADLSINGQTNFYTCSGVGYSGSFGVQMSPKFYVGLGLAAQIYIDYWYYGTYNENEPELYAQMPLFVDLRYDMLPTRISPFVAVRTGYALSIDEVNDFSGFYLNPSFGVRAKSLSMSIGVDLVKLKDPWYFDELLVNMQHRNTMVEWQSSIMFKIAYEWGGRQ
ncbi:MAG: hypothetical protein K6F33_02755 [Bacteroidales bacterium]|nr:hypothetical protein [Bacteroidales bacterium]